MMKIIWTNNAEFNLILFHFKHQIIQMQYILIKISSTKKKKK